MIDLYVQVIIVVFMSLDENYVTDHSVGVKTLLITCLIWISIRELVQLALTKPKLYIEKASNWIDLLQIVFLSWIITIIYHERDHNHSRTAYACAICISWLALIFDLSDLHFQLAVFVTSAVEIMKGLIPFMFVAVLLACMFAHAFRAMHFEETCIKTDLDLPSVDGWKSCSTIGQSYTQALIWLLSSDTWDFTEGAGLVLTCIYALIMGVILLNMIIAIVNDIFTKVQNEAQTAFWENRLSTTIEIEAMLGIYTPLDKYLKKTFKFSETTRFNFLVASSQSADVGNSKSFFNWWFSPVAMSDKIPTLRMRLQAFYSYSLWDDIIYPGEVLERILLGVNYDFDDNSEERLKCNNPSFPSKVIVKIF